MNSSRVDLKQLAEHLNLSQATVSRALSGHTAISLKTRERVAEAAQVTGYRPNHAARRLALGRTHVIGLVFPLERLLLPQTNFVEVLSGITETASARGYDLALSPFTDDEASVYRRLAATRSVDGLIITRPRVHDERITLLRMLQLPFVVHGRSETDEAYSFSDIDNDAVFGVAASTLLDLGHTRIASLNAPPEFRYAFARRRGLQRAFDDRGLLLDPEMQLSGDMSDQVGHDLTSRLLDRPVRPTALICGSVFMAKGAYRAIAAYGLRPGIDIAVIAHDDLVRGIDAAMFDPPLTTTEASIKETGHRLGAILLDLVESVTLSDSVREIRPVRLIVRASADQL